MKNKILLSTILLSGLLMFNAANAQRSWQNKGNSSGNYNQDQHTQQQQNNGPSAQYGGGQYSQQAHEQPATYGNGRNDYGRDNNVHENYGRDNYDRNDYGRGRTDDRGYGRRQERFRRWERERFFEHYRHHDRW